MNRRHFLSGGEELSEQANSQVRPPAGPRCRFAIARCSLRLPHPRARSRPSGRTCGSRISRPSV